MLKGLLGQIKAMSEQTLDQRLSAWAMFNKQMTSTLLSAFDEKRKVVWTSYYAFPIELLAAFDVVPFDFEIACNTLPGTEPDTAVSLMSQAEGEGYATDLCSFHRLTFGYDLKEALPKADLMLTSSYFCDGKTKANQILAERRDQTSIMLDVPNELSKESVAYVSGQLKKIAGELEKVTGQKLDQDRLKTCIRHSNEARKLYMRLAELHKETPFPWNGIRTINLSIIGNMFAGTPFQAELYRAIVEEIEARIASGRVRPEKHRIAWLAWCPTLTTVIPEVLKQTQTSIVMGELARVFWDEMDEESPFEGMALKCLKNPFVGPVDQRIEGILEIAETYNVDGAIHFSSLACRHANASFRMIQDALDQKNIPLLVLEGDMSDARNYSEGQTRASLEAFVETLDIR